MKKQKSSAKQPKPARVPSHDEIAALAHSFWEAEGRPEGAELRLWLKAEAALSAPPSAAPEDPA